jgi:endonuclease/exonuclease/phosphatase (EEP) superfamily protein YafD
MLANILRWVVVVIGTLMVAGTLVSFSRSPHWAVRNWDVPRLQMAIVAAAAGSLYALFFRGQPYDVLFLAATGTCAAWQCYKILPYTRLARVRVKRGERQPGRSFTVMVCNVLMENREHHRFLAQVRRSDPDMVLALETDDTWNCALEPLARDYPYAVRYPQDNYYGMVFFSRLPLIDPQVRFLVQDDIPSLHTSVELPSGDQIFLHGLHPRPPEPIRDQDSTPRDAELVLLGREIGRHHNRPTVVAGDLNDVAWSPTSELFLTLSGLLDPRVGRGLFNSYNAKSRIFRFPLDHVFHSNEFCLVDLQRLPEVGSDHFPILIELTYDPRAATEQEETREEPGDQQEAQERLELETEAARTGDDRPGRE